MEDDITTHQRAAYRNHLANCELPDWVMQLIEGPTQDAAPAPLATLADGVAIVDYTR